MKRITTSILIVLLNMLIVNNTVSQESFSGSVRLRNFNKNIYDEKKTKYKLSSSNKQFTLLNNNFQKIISKNTTKNIKIIYLESGEINSKKLKVTKDFSKYLQDTRFLNLTNKKIIIASKKFSKSKNSVYDIENFTYHHINDKISGIPLLPAKEILLSRSGDCTEHAILSIALLRANKIPSRAVVGMILAKEFQGFKNIFVFHMWVEAFVKNKWQIVDSTRPGKKSLNRYIAFSHHSLRTEMPISYMKAISAIQNLDVEYISGE